MTESYVYGRTIVDPASVSPGVGNLTPAQQGAAAARETLLADISVLPQEEQDKILERLGKFGELEKSVKGVKATK